MKLDRTAGDFPVEKPRAKSSFLAIISNVGGEDLGTKRPTPTMHALPDS